MDIRKYEYQSDFARRYVAQGQAEGEAKGRVALVARLLALARLRQNQRLGLLKHRSRIWMG
jgi:hypothetical protein